MNKEINLNKMKFFETKVVKVKKGKKECNHLNAPCIHTYIYNGEIRCPQCGKILTPEWLEKRIIIDPLLVKEEKKGNWVNGENLDKIKFPCFCSYGGRVSGGKKSDRKHGLLLKLGNHYYIINIDKQGDYTQYFFCYGLDFLIKEFDIHILKGKIILFEGGRINE